MRWHPMISRMAGFIGGRPLAFQLRLLALATAVPLLILALLMFRQMVGQERESVKLGLITNARTLAALVDNEIKVHAAIAATLAHSPALLAADWHAFWHEARAALKFVPGSWLTVTSADGGIVLTTLQPVGTPLPKHAAPDLVERGFATRSFQVSDLILAAASKRLATLVEMPVFKNDKPAYSLSIALPPDSFLQLIERQFAQGYVVAIIDRQSKFVARIPDHANRVGSLAAQGWRDAIARAREGWSENVSVEGNWILTGHAPTAQGWTVGVARLEANLNQPVQQVIWQVAVAGGLLLLSSLVLAWWLSARAGRSMVALAAAAHAVGHGRPLPAAATSFAEAAVIASSLATASEELRKRGDELTRINRRLESDVAERTQDLVAEMRRREEAESTLRQTQKMEAIGQLTGGIAHDFNNMLTIVIGNLDTLQRRLRSTEEPPSGKLSGPVEAAMKGARNAAKLTHRLLAFARQQPLAPHPIDVRNLVSGMADMLTRMAGETIKIETVCGTGLWPTLADENQLENALLNLVVNARDAMPDGGRITIETSNAYLDDDYVARAGDVASGQYVLLSVSDTGAGIPAENLEKVFEPFFTTKPQGEGTGLGLSMIHGFVKQSGGHIRIYSEVGHGTTVRLYLPRYQFELSTATGPPEPRTLVSHAGAGETILLVEDDDDVRAYAIDVLRDHGCRVIEADDGETALRALADAGRIDLLLTDVVLGGSLNGRQIADEARKMRPDMPVLFTTGYTRNAIVHHGRLDAGVNLLGKPYTSSELIRSIRQLIDGPAGLSSPVNGDR